jgi:ATP-dependent DNA helicase RecG
MLTEEQLKALLFDQETDRIERTISINKSDKFGQAICAFANDLPNHRQPGYLLVGVNDNGALSGLAPNAPAQPTQGFFSSVKIPAFSCPEATSSF